MAINFGQCRVLLFRIRLYILGYSLNTRPVSTRYLMPDPILYETHCHTPLCKHAQGQPEEYAAVALQRGLKGLIVTCHNAMPDGFGCHVRMDPSEFDQYVRIVERARQAWSGKVDVRLGLEADYFPGYEDWLDRQLDSAHFHYVLGSVHPQLAEMKDRYWRGDPLEYQRVYFRLIADAAETGLFDTISHPDVVKIVSPTEWHPDVLMDDVKAALDRIAATGVAMELNTSGANKVPAQMNPFPAMLVEMAKRSIHVVVGADAHQPARVGEGFDRAFDLLEQCGYNSVSSFLDRKRYDFSIRDARASLSAGPLDGTV